MNQRERMLLLVLISVGSLGIVFGGYLAYSSVTGWLQSGKTRVANLQKQLADKKKLVAQTEAAKRKIADWQKRSLPPEPTLASSLYRDWLLGLLVDRKLAETQVAADKQTPEKGLYTLLSFNASGKGTLRQIVELLYDFYSVDRLHRISRMSILPAKDPKQFNFKMTVEALSMLGAPETNQLDNPPGKRLEMPSRDDYLTAILGRNIFGDPNQPPSLSGLGSQSGVNGEAFRATAVAKDGDVPPDKFTFKLEKSDVQDARLDSSSGEFRFTPRRTGTYEFVISVTDDGFPPKSATERLVVTVGDRAVPPPIARTPNFDEAKYTVLAAVIDKSGAGEVWLHVRPRERNSMLKLGVGDSFEVGSVKGVVKSIGAADFTFESDGKLKKLGSNESLDKAVASPQ